MPTSFLRMDKFYLPPKLVRYPAGIKTAAIAMRSASDAA